MFIVNIYTVFCLIVFLCVLQFTKDKGHFVFRYKLRFHKYSSHRQIIFTHTS